MKLLIIPIIIALFAGIGGGSGYAYMRASKAFVVDSAQRADSLKAHPPTSHIADSTAIEPVLHDVVPDDSAGRSVHEPQTPADSLRALAAARASLKESTKGLRDATPAPMSAHGVPVAHEANPAPLEKTPRAAIQDLPQSATPDAEHAMKPAKTRATAPEVKSEASASPAKRSGTSPVPSTGAVATALRDARNEAMATALPEQRLAKIFGAMQAKEAAKVLEQMGDDDVRTIVGMMSDRQAAAILSTFPAARAAAITRGVNRSPEVKP